MHGRLDVRLVGLGSPYATAHGPTQPALNGTGWGDLHKTCSVRCHRYPGASETTPDIYVWPTHVVLLSPVESLNAQVILEVYREDVSV